MREILEYWIPENKVPFDKKSKSKTAKKGGSETDALKRDAPKKGKGKKSNTSDKGKKKVQTLQTREKGRCPRLLYGFRLRIKRRRRNRTAS